MAAKSKTVKTAVKPAAKAKAPAKKVTRPIPTPDAPLPSGWVRQSTVGPDAGAASKFTTQTQRRLLRTVASGEDFDYGEGVHGPVNVGNLPTATQRTVDRLRSLGFVTVAKNGDVKATKAGTAFVAANPAPRERSAAKPAAKKVAAKKPAAKGTGRKVATKAKPAAKSAPAPVASTASKRSAQRARIAKVAVKKTR